MKPLHILLLLCLCLGGYGQKHDGLWMIGHGGITTTDTNYSISNLDFRSLPAFSVFSQFRPISLQIGGASICDKYGELQFYTNGMQIRNRDNLPMTNGIGLSPGQVATDFSVQGGAYPSLRGGVIIPKPAEDSVYYFLHGGMEYNSPQDGGFYKYLYYTVIDMRLQNGLGEVTDKNHVLLEALLLLDGGTMTWIQENLLVSGGGIGLTKHANGRDWWIVVRKARTTNFYKYLLSPTGIDTVGVQSIGDTVHVPPGRLCSVFTPDGNKFIYSNDRSQLHILDFDRCSGDFSNHQRFDVVDSLIEATNGVPYDGLAVSPSSRFLYVSTSSELRQFDLTASNIQQSEVRICNLWEQPDPAKVCFSQLAPDGKIYLVPIKQDTFLHVINYPDSQGLACGFVKNGLELPSRNLTYLPYYPNYRLGALPGSPCDTLTAISHEQLAVREKQIKVFPNPATDVVTVDYGFTDWSKTGELSLEITNQLGQTVYTQALPAYSGFQKINIATFAGGMYQVFIKRGTQTIAVGKFAKQ